MQILSGVSFVSITGDVVGSGIGEVPTTIANAAVTYAKMQDISAASRLLGRGSAAGAGDVEEIALGAGLSMSGTTLDAAPKTVTGTLFLCFDGGSSAIAANSKRDLRVPFAGTITKATLMSDASTTSVVNVWVDTFANYPPTVADKITASAPPTLTATDHVEDSTLTGWTTAFAAGSTFRANVDSNNNAKELVLQLDYTRTL
jgi:hypothetical protein